MVKQWRGTQDRAPLLEALVRSGRRDHAPFYAPGHKLGRGISAELQAAWGAAIFQADLPELPELDNLFAPEGVIEEAQGLAAEVFGAEQTWFLANGSTCGIEAAVLATCGPGQQIIVPRNAHRSVVSALILAGAVPIWVMPEYDAAWDLAYGLSPHRVRQALAAHPDCRAMLVVSPTYQGVCADIPALAALAHDRGIPLLVDEAHGPHFAFHPDLPTPALAAGADLVVQSTHKVLAALTQASMLHGQGNRIDRSRLQRALQLTQSTSPSYLLLASLDAARHQMAQDGFACMERTLALARQVRSHLAAIPGVGVLDLDHRSPAHLAGFRDLDPTRLTLKVSDLGMTGFEADQILHGKLGVTAELPTLRHLTFILSLGNTPADGDRLVQAIATLAAAPAFSEGSGDSPGAAPAASTRLGAPQPSPADPPAVSAPAIAGQIPPLTPRQAFFAPVQTLPLDQAIGQLSGETLCPYPPGIPLILPGEVITAAAIDTLLQIRQAGGKITGCTDTTLAHLAIIPPASIPPESCFP